METCRTVSPSPERLHRDLECRPDERWRGAAGLMCRQECAASCPRSSCPHRTRADQCTPPCFCAFHALAVDDGGGRTGLPLLSIATLLVKRVVNSFQCAVIGPQIEVVIDRAFRRQVFRDRAPLTAGRENVHEAVHYLPYVHGAL